MARNLSPDINKSGDAKQNQLTLIVLLIILVVIAIALAFAVSAPSLSNIQKWVFLAALILFPFFSISTITWLILRHSRKLVVSSNDAVLEWVTTSPEKQKRKLNIEVRELAESLDLSADQLTDLRSAYIVAEDLALRKVQDETGVPMMRKIEIGGADFDGIWIDNDLITFVEVTFVVAPVINQKKIDKFLRKSTAAKSDLEKSRKGSRVRLLLVIVTQLDRNADEILRANVKKNFKSTPVDVDIRFLDFLNLQQIYAED